MTRYNSHGGGVGPSKTKPSPSKTKPSPSIVPSDAAPPPQEPRSSRRGARPLTLQDLPANVLHKIFTVHKAFTNISTYSEALRIANEIEPGIIYVNRKIKVHHNANPQEIIDPDFVSPDTIEVTEKNQATPIVFNTMQAFREYKQSTNLEQVETIRMLGKSVAVTIPYGKEDPLIGVHVFKPNTTDRLFSFGMWYTRMRKNPACIMIYKVLLTLFLVNEDPIEVTFLNDIHVGASWITEVFTSIQRIPSFSFRNAEHVTMIDVAADKTLHVIPYVYVKAILNSKAEETVGLKTNILNLLEYIDKRIIQKKIGRPTDDCNPRKAILKGT